MKMREHAELARLDQHAEEFANPVLAVEIDRIKRSSMVIIDDNIANDDTKENEIVSEIDRISERIRTCKKGDGMESCDVLLSRRTKLAEELCKIKDEEREKRRCHEASG